MRWRLMVRIDDTDAPGALEATQLVKAVLVEEYELRPLPKILRGPV